MIDLLEHIGVPVWTRGNLDTHGDRCIRSITKALWYIDANHGQFVDRSIKIPELSGINSVYNSLYRNYYLMLHE